MNNQIQGNAVNNKSPEPLERNIEQTQAQLSEDVNALTHNLSRTASIDSAKGTPQEMSVTRRIRHPLEKQPLLVGALALLMGVVIALVLPRTRREDTRFGGASDALRAHAIAVAKKTSEAVKKTAEREAEEIKGEVMRVIKRVAEAAKHTAAEVKRTALKEIKKSHP
jgi:hypothetical protein